MPTPNVYPAYSHGGTAPLGWSVVAGTAVGSGNPISLLSADGLGEGAFLRCFNRGTATVIFVVEESATALTSGVPDANSWTVIPLTWTQQTIQLESSESAVLYVGGRGPWIRTRITSLVTGGQLESSISLMTASREVFHLSPHNPMLSNNATEGQ